MAFTPIFWDGFEDGGLKRWTSTTGYGTGSTYKKYGTYSGNLTGNGRNYASYTLPSSESELYGGCWIRPDGWWTSASYKSPVIAMGDGSNWWFALAGHYGTTDIYYTYDKGSTWTQIPSYSWTMSDWNHVEWYVKVHASTGAIGVKLNDTQILNATGLDTTTSGTYGDFTRVCVGAPISYTGIIRHDNYMIGTGGYPSNLLIERLAPTGDGNTTDWDTSTGTDHYALVDEVPVSTSDYVGTNTVNEVELFTFDNLSGNIGDVYGVAVVADMGEDGTPTPGNVQGVTRISSTNYNTGSLNAPTDGALFHLWTASPATASDWTEAEINAAEFGQESKA